MDTRKATKWEDWSTRRQTELHLNSLSLSVHRSDGKWFVTFEPFFVGKELKSEELEEAKEEAASAAFVALTEELSLLARRSR